MNMRTLIGFGILAAAGVAGYFILPYVLKSTSKSPGQTALDQSATNATQAAGAAVDSAMGAASVPVDVGAEILGEVAEAPWWTWVIPGGQFAYAAYSETAEELSGAED